MYTFKPVLAAMVLIAAYVNASFLPETGSNVVRSQNEPISLTFGAAQWLWTGEEGTPGGNVAGLVSRGFRKDIGIIPPAFEFPACLTLAVAADNGYDLYVNGINIGNDNEKFGLVSAFEEADTYNIPLNAEGQNIIAINVTNAGSTPTPAGVIVTGVIQFSNGLQQVLVSDSSWVTLAAQTPVNFFEVTFDDAAWIPASEQGTNGVGPWGITTIVPNTVECPNF